MSTKTEVQKEVERFTLSHTIMLALEATREALRKVFTQEVIWDEVDISAEPIQNDFELRRSQAEESDKNNHSRTVRIRASVRAPLAETTSDYNCSIEAVCELHVFAGETWEPRRVTLEVCGKTYDFDFDSDFFGWQSEEMENPAFRIHEYEFPYNLD